jgi:hypothetical protein
MHDWNFNDYIKLYIYIYIHCALKLRISLFQEASQIPEILTARIAEAKLNGIQIQPFMLVVGEPSNIVSVVVVIDQTFWATPSIRAAFDMLFKTFFVLNVQYPVPTIKMFSFFQRCVYKISCVTDTTLVKSAVYTVANEINLNVEDE